MEELLEELTEEEFRHCLKLHGYCSSEESSDDEPNPHFEELFGAYRPPPIEIDPAKHRIIEIGRCITKTTSLINLYEKNPARVETGVGKLSKSQKKRRRKRLRSGKSVQSLLSDTPTNLDVIDNEPIIVQLQEEIEQAKPLTYAEALKSAPKSKPVEHQFGNVKKKKKKKQKTTTSNSTSNITRKWKSLNKIF